MTKIIKAFGNRIISIVTVAVCILSLLPNSLKTAYASEENDFMNYLSNEKFIEDSVYENEIVLGKWNGFFYDTSQKQFAMPSGILAVKTADFDNDGNNEMLVIKSDGINNANGQTKNVLTALMLVCKNGIIIEQSNCVIAEDLVDSISTTGYTDVFIKKENDQYIIACEQKDIASFWADGVRWKLRTYTYENGSFNSKANYKEEGSYFEDDQSNQILEKVKELGFSINEIFERIIENNNSVETICSISHDYGSEYSMFWDAIKDKRTKAVMPIIVKIHSVNEQMKTDDAIKIKLNDKYISLKNPPINESGTILVPLRGVFESMGVTVEWNNEMKTITATQNETVIILKIGEKNGLIGSKTYALDVSPKIINDKTYMPVRFVAESLGCKVKWDPLTNTVEITQ